MAKDGKVVVLMEQPLIEIAGEVAKEEGKSLSGYVRHLVVRDMIDKHKIPGDVMTQIVLGEPA